MPLYIIYAPTNPSLSLKKEKGLKKKVCLSELYLLVSGQRHCEKGPIIALLSCFLFRYMFESINTLQ